MKFAVIFILPVAITLYGTFLCWEGSTTILSTPLHAVRNTVQKQVSTNAELLSSLRGLLHSIVHIGPDNKKVKRHRKRSKFKRAGWRKCKRLKGCKKNVKRKRKHQTRLELKQSKGKDEESRNYQANEITGNPLKGNTKTKVSILCDQTSNNPPDKSQLSQPPKLYTSQQTSHDHTNNKMNNSLKCKSVTENHNILSNTQVYKNSTSLTHPDSICSQCHSHSSSRGSEQFILAQLIILPVKDTDCKLDETISSQRKCFVLKSINNEVIPHWENG